MNKKTDEEEGFVRAKIEDSFSLKAFAQEAGSYQISKLRLLCVGVFGVLLGMVLSLAVNSVLFEISVNRMFSFYFGLIFCLVGSFIMMRAWTQNSVAKRVSVTVLAAVVIGAGACSFLFRTEWLWWSSLTKVLIYTLLGVATNFTVTFSWVDIVSFIHDVSKRHEQGPSHRWGLVESPVQVWLIMVVSIVSGITYGLIFGLVQMEEMTEKHHSRYRLMRSLGMTEVFSLPFGAVLGGATALVNEYLRHKNMIATLRKDIEYKPLEASDVDGI